MRKKGLEVLRIVNPVDEFASTAEGIRQKEAELHNQPSPVDEYVAPTPAVLYAVPAPVVEYVGDVRDTRDQDDSTHNSCYLASDHGHDCFFSNDT